MSNWHLPGQTIDNSAVFSLPVLFPQLAWLSRYLRYCIMYKNRATHVTDNTFTPLKAPLSLTHMCVVQLDAPSVSKQNANLLFHGRRIRLVKKGPNVALFNSLILF